MSDAPAMSELLGADAPTQLGQVGSRRRAGRAELPRRQGGAARGRSTSAAGDVFTLQIQMGRTDGPGDPLWPGRTGIERQNVLDEGTWDGDGAPAFPGGLHYADDTAKIFLQGSTQYDALGHVWYDGKLWNGYDARTTIGGDGPRPRCCRSRRRAWSAAGC